MSSSRAPSHRAAAGLAVLGVTTVVSYAAQRLWAAASPVGSMDASIVASVHIPYYWRCATALFHGLVLGGLAGWGLKAPEAARLLRAGPWWIVGLVVPSAVAMLVVP